jgi:protein SCO1/2
VKQEEMMNNRPSSTGPTKFRVAGTVALGIASALACASSAMAVDSHDHHHHEAARHAQHAGHPDAAGYTRSTAGYAVPDVYLVDSQGATVALQRELGEQTGPVLLNFIFTTCGAVCPVMSSTFSQVQDALGGERKTVRMLSISIDPEQDTPAALQAYAGRYRAGAGWQMLTGSVADSIAVQRAFDVYRGDKMNHAPATFLRARAGEPWVRLDGFASAEDILRELGGLQRE